MAMKLKGLSLKGTAVIVLLIAVALIPPEHYGSRTRTAAPGHFNPFRHARDDLSRKLLRAKTALYLGERAADALADTPASGPTSVTTTPDFPAHLTRYLEDRIPEHWRELDGRDDVRIAVHASLDTAGFSDNWRDRARREAGLGVREPVRNPVRRVDWRVRPVTNQDGTSCVIAVTVGRWTLGSLEGDPPWSNAEYVLRPNRSIDMLPGLGACGFVAAFGPPGRHVGTWLDSTDYTFARVADWSARHTPHPDSIRSLPAYWSREDVAVLGCAAGKRDACRRALLRTAWSTYTPRSIESLEVPGWYGFNHTYASFGDHAPYLLSDMVHDVGRDAFTRFWQSELPLEEAFREATGQDLLRWTAEWTREYLGPAPHSPRVRVVTLLLSLAAAGLAVGFAGMVNQRRGG